MAYDRRVSAATLDPGPLGAPTDVPTPAHSRPCSGLLALCLGTALLVGACRSPGAGTLSAVDWERAEHATASGDWTRAASYWNHIRRNESPATPRPQLQTADALLHLGRTDDALAMLDAGLVQFPESPDFLLARARLQRQLGFRRAAERDALTAVGRAPTDVDGWILLASLRLELESPTRAAEAAERALALAPERSDVRLLAARAYAGMGDAERAHQNFAHVLTAEGNRTYELLLEASILHAVDGPHTTQVDAALGWIAEALEMSPRCPRASFVEGCLLERAGHAERAKLAYRRAIESDNFHLAAMTNLALLCAAEGDRGGAEEMVERILALDLERDPTRRRALRELIDAPAGP